MTDALDAIMAVMGAAFDPLYGEAWNRRQVGDALTVRGTNFLLADRDGLPPASPDETCGFTLSRMVADEEELLLIAVHPDARGRGIGGALMQRFVEEAQNRGAVRLFLEMRDGNPAQNLYQRHGFIPVGRRRDYYQFGTQGPIDAITYARIAS